jgi:hypothetical protein
LQVADVRYSASIVDGRSRRTVKPCGVATLCSATKRRSWLPVDQIWDRPRHAPASDGNLAASWSDRWIGTRIEPCACRGGMAGTGPFARALVALDHAMV